MKRLLVSSLLLLAGFFFLAALAPTSDAAEHPYVGTNNCKKCHIKEWRSWSETKMAKTFDTLKPGVAAEAKTKAGLDPTKDYTKDPSCLACHTVGYGKEGGFKDLESTPDRAGVGCEMCHGAGGTYTKSGYMTLQNKEYKRADLVAVGLVGEITVAQCQTCHNTDSPFVGPDYKFDFEANKDKGVHERFPLRYKH